MTQTMDLADELRNIVADIEKLYEEQRNTLVERWGEDGDVPTEDLPEYDEITYNQLVEDADLLGSIRRRLVEVIGPKAAA